MTNQKSNLYIKEIAKLANISKYLTYHTSRHTFGTIAVQILPITVVQSILQHSDIKTTMVYLHLSNKERNETISKSKGKWK
jgi:site-specific recombinase XerD